MVVDFAALPPEVNSGRMYAGAGAGPLVAAASAWDGVAAELSSAARSYQAVVSEVTSGVWLGPSSVSLAAAAAPYAAWMNTTAAQAEQTANQARSSAAAYEAAFAATVPPPLIAANRALLASLVATNILGQNTPAIAATEVQYAEMWAQDAAAMYNYAGTSAAATTLTSFATPQQNTNPTGLSAQTAAVNQVTSTSASSTSSALSQLFSAVPNTLQGLASGQSFNPLTLLENLLNSPLVQMYETLNTATGGYSAFIEGGTFLSSGIGLTAAPMIMTPMTMAVTAAAAAPAAAAPAEGVAAGLANSVGPEVGTIGSAGLGGAAASAGLGEATSVGGLSVPQSWATAAPAIRLASAAMPITGMESLPQVAAAGAGSWLGGMPMMGNVINAPRGADAGPRSGSDRTKTRHTAGQPGIHEDVPGWSVPPDRADIGGRPSERAELNELRKIAADLAKERDVLKRSAALLINEAMQR